jgi:probable rRNA maturation factor
MSVVLSGPPECASAAHLDLPRLRARAIRVLKELGHARSELSLSLVDDAEIAELNAAYREKPRATDVLSFSLLEGDHAAHRGQLLGDVVISVETAAAQARERHRSLDETVARLLIHGVLHLLGHDHEQDDEARAMQAEERRLWRALIQ